MAGEPRGTAQLRVMCESGWDHYDLRFYGSDEFVVPCGWIGIFDAAGDLRATGVLQGMDRTPDDVLRWLKPIAGADVAGRLVGFAMEAAREGRRGRRQSA